MPSEELIISAFLRVEAALVSSMFRNLKRHRAREDAEGFQWVQWQAVQLRDWFEYRTDTLTKARRDFDSYNAEVAKLLEDAYSHAEETELDKAERAAQGGYEGGLLGIPEDRLGALVESVTDDLGSAEHAVLRKAQDVYRETILTAAFYSQAGTYAQAIDMATKDFLSKGLTAIRYRNGSMHSIGEYAQMAVRTAAKRAALVAEGAVRDSLGVHTVYVDYRDDACPECAAWVGEILVDDVYSGGTREEAEELGYGLLSDAMEEGLFHPNCRDTLSTYYPGVSEVPPRPTAEETAKSEIQEEAEQIRNRAIAEARKYKRIADNSLDPSNRAKARAKEKEWDAKAESPAYQGKNRGSGFARSQNGVPIPDDMAAIRKEIEKYPKLLGEPPEVFEQLDAVEGGAEFVTVYRATPGDSINNGDWVFLSREQAERFSRSRFSGQRRTGYKVLSERVPASDVHWTGKNLEFAFFGEGGNSEVVRPEVGDAAEDVIRAGIASADYGEGIDGGFTVDISSGRAYELGKYEGYAVGGFGQELILPPEQYNDPVKRRQALAEYAMDNAEALDQEGACLGGWVPTDPDNPRKGYLFLDVSRVTTDREQAARWAIERGEDSITDFANFDWPSTEDLAKEYGMLDEYWEARTKKTAEREGWASEHEEKTLRLAGRVKSRAVQEEPAVTADLSAAVAKGSGRLEGLDYRLKGEKSIARKIRDKSKAKGLDQEAYAGMLTDILRFTNVSEPENLYDDYVTITRELGRKGYNVVEVENTLGTPDVEYRGINTLVQTPSGYVFELQYHTPQSLEVKEVNHKLYEEQREPTTSPERAAELGYEMLRNANAIAVPKDVGKIGNLERS